MYQIVGLLLISIVGFLRILAIPIHPMFSIIWATIILPILYKPKFHVNILWIPFVLHSIFTSESIRTRVFTTLLLGYVLFSIAFPKHLAIGLFCTTALYYILYVKLPLEGTGVDFSMLVYPPSFLAVFISATIQKTYQ